MTFQPFEKQIDRVIEAALAEDISRGDITSEILIPPDLQGKASIMVKASGVVAGTEIAARAFVKVDPSLAIEVLIKDGAGVKPGDIIMNVSGSVRSILKTERTALNFLQRLSGIASLTAQFVAKAQGTRAVICETRKTTPGLRALEKYAVRMGGGHNHRLDLADAILVKDNHVAALKALGMSYKDIVAKASQGAPQGTKVEAEARTAQEALDAAEAGADMVMLDNMSIDDMRHAVSLLGGRVKVEASGGINLDNVKAVADTGVDIISVGALTHSPKALDISLELEPQTFKLI